MNQLNIDVDPADLKTVQSILKKFVPNNIVWVFAKNHVDWADTACFSQWKPKS
jgi:hypothetical protein